MARIAAAAPTVHSARGSASAPASLRDPLSARAAQAATDPDYPLKQQLMLAVLRGGQEAQGFGTAAALGDRAEHRPRQAVIPEGHTASRAASQAATSAFMVPRTWSMRRMRSGQ
jgi:hypothetical protein